MFKRIFVFIAFISLAGTAFGQKNFQVTIQLDSSLVLKKVNYLYNNGKRDVILGDSISKSPNIIIKGEYFSRFVTLQIAYVNNAGFLYSNRYLVDDKPAQIYLYYKPNIDQLLLHKRLVNVRAAYDTVSNKTYRELYNYNRKENLAVYNFTQQHPDLNTSDSLQKIYWKMLRSVHHRTLSFLKDHADDYYSFWYFQNEIAFLNLNPNSGADTALLREELAYFQAAFPKKITQSFEGMELIDAYKKRINPLKKNIASPNFTVKTIDGKALNLNDLKGRFVLIDFWATWCGPCMREIPFVKLLRAQYPESKLAIIGISRDRDLNAMKRVIKDKGMNWYHYFDKETDISRLYGVDIFPSYFLLDEQGKIIYSSNNISDDAAKLKEILH
jgi:peroxiredoxin